MRAVEAEKRERRITAGKKGGFSRVPLGIGLKPLNRNRVYGILDMNYQTDWKLQLIENSNLTQISTDVPALLCFLTGKKEKRIGKPILNLISSAQTWVRKGKGGERGGTGREDETNSMFMKSYFISFSLRCREQGQAESIMTFTADTAAVCVKQMWNGF